MQRTGSLEDLFPTDVIPTIRAPRITAPMLEAATYTHTAVVVQDAHGAVYTLPQLTPAQADDPSLVVLVDHHTALDAIAGTGGRVAAAAKRITVELAQQHARGLL